MDDFQWHRDIHMFILQLLCLHITYKSIFKCYWLLLQCILELPSRHIEPQQVLTATYCPQMPLSLLYCPEVSVSSFPLLARGEWLPPTPSSVFCQRDWRTAFLTNSYAQIPFLCLCLLCSSFFQPLGSLGKSVFSLYCLEPLLPNLQLAPEVLSSYFPIARTPLSSL